MKSKCSALLILALAAPCPGVAESVAARSAILPPLPAWHGDSEQLIAPADDPWQTPAEASGLTETPRYAETVAWLQRLADASPRLTLKAIGTSAEQRTLWMVVANAEGASDPDDLRDSGRPTLLAHAGIHAGEIDGKDAGLMLLRDLTSGRRLDGLLDKVNLLFIPILSVDGHERFSAYNRINQRGPREMGWRTNGRNLNLNRDFAKLDTLEVRALVAAINRWQPDLYIDLHVTDGQDYQYDITYGYNGPHGWSPAIAGWLDNRFSPAIDAALKKAGHVPGPLVFAVNERDMSEGNLEWTAPPRFSTGWGDARHLPSVLVENHSLKPYRQRVLGTYVFMQAAMVSLAEHAEELRQAVARDRVPRERVALDWTVDPAKTPENVPFLGIRSETELSAISGTPVVRWTGEPIEQQIPLLVMDKATIEIARPDAYYIPAAWRHLGAMLLAQGIEVEELTAPVEVKVERYRLPEATLDAEASPFEGRSRYQTGQIEGEQATVNLGPGSLKISTDQPLGTLAVLLLEPQASDSLFQWGLFASVLQRTEYVEAYVMEPMARAMLAEDPALLARFQERLESDPEFAADSRERLMWFYRQTPFFDARHRRYPVLRSVD